jgi:hypothetical protein
MKKNTLSGLLILILALALFTLSGCLGDNNTEDTIPPPQSTTATVKILSAGTGTIYGIDVALVLPAGVTVKATSDGNKMVTNTGVVAASGMAAGANAIATYTAAAGATAGKVTILVANSAGFTAGEFVTVNCDIAAGSVPTAADFSLEGFAPVNGNGAPITGLTVALTADIK